MNALHPEYDDRLREAMVSSGVLPEDVAEAADVPLCRVHEMLAGEFRPRRETRERLESALDCDLSLLVCECCGEAGPDLRDGYWDVGGRIERDLLCADCRRPKEDLEAML